MITNYYIEKDAPGFLATLRKLLPASSIAILTDDFQQVCALGGADESEIQRAKDASFNPRPARVAMISIGDGHLTALPQIRLALWSCVPTPGTERLPDDLELQQKIASVRIGVLESRVADPVVATVILANRLDRLRHIHMTAAAHDEIVALADGTEETLAVCSVVPVSECLLRKVEHCIALQRRRLDRVSGGE